MWLAMCPLATFIHNHLKKQLTFKAITKLGLEFGINTHECQCQGKNFGRETKTEYQQYYRAQL